VAPIIWQSLGNCRHYLEPFAGSLAVLLARPYRPCVETVNDLDGCLVNLWRALAVDPRAVVQYADWRCRAWTCGRGTIISAARATL
jgi:site-specific DNA-adenine methylase